MLLDVLSNGRQAWLVGLGASPASKIVELVG
jgi:hypothetical protein